MSFVDSLMPDFLLSEDKKISRHQRRVTNRDSQPEDRESSARWLAENGSAKALYALCTRFDMNLTQSMHNKDEKDFVYSLLANQGEPVKKPLKQWLKKCRQIAMPLRLHIDLCGEEATIELVYDLLQIELDKDDFKPAKKHDLLVWLADKPHPDRITHASKFCDDFDETVRYAAAEVIIAQQSDEGREPLLGMLANDKEDSIRLRVRICDTFVGRKWSVAGVELDGKLPDNYTVRDDLIVANR